MTPSKNDIKYRYALDGENIVDIKAQEQPPRKDYTCLSCGHILRPTYCKVRQNHFRHQVESVCSKETYLHNLAKRSFFQTYSDCLINNIPFFVERLIPKQCNACKDFGPCYVGYELKQADLTQMWKEQPFLEAYDGTFKPDILLKSSIGSLWFEIAVTHYVTENKGNAGIRIIEIKIDAEQDIDMIIACHISESDSRVTISNFNVEPIIDNFHKECQNKIQCFVLYPSGESAFSRVLSWKYEELISDSTYVERIDTLLTEAEAKKVYINKIEELYIKGLHIKNCWLCDNHILHPKTENDFCKLNQLDVQNETNKAVGCKQYKQKITIPECGLINNAIDVMMKQREVNKQHLKNRTDYERRGFTSFQKLTLGDKRRSLPRYVPQAHRYIVSFYASDGKDLDYCFSGDIPACKFIITQKTPTFPPGTYAEIQYTMGPDEIIYTHSPA